MNYFNMKDCKKCHKTIFSKGLTGLCRSCVQFGNTKGKGKKLTKKHRKILSIGRLADKNPMWKGEKVGKIALHEWVRYRLKQPNKCQDCKKEYKTLDLANISQEYKRDLNDWEWLCRRCHMLKDGRLEKLVKTDKMKNRISKKLVVVCKYCKKQYLVYPSRFRENNYCSPEHANLHRFY